MQDKFALFPAADAPEKLDTCGLPLATSEHRTEMLEAWCLRGSWQMCAKCHSVSPKPLRAEDLLRESKATRGSTKCKNCAHGKYAPQPADIPEPLRGLSVEVVEALRPFEVDVGTERRAQYGYRIKVGMIGFSWKVTDVEEGFASLDVAAARRRAKGAFDFLMQCEESRYMFFIHEHRRFLGESEATPCIVFLENIESAS